MTIERRVRIFRDSDAYNPREEHDSHVGRMLCWHSRYNLGDEHNYDSDTWKEELACEVDSDLEEKLEELREVTLNVYYDCLTRDGGMDWQEASALSEKWVEDRCAAWIDKAFDDNYVALPLYLYDHSGITMNTGGFSCGWDSGCVGVIVCTKEQVQEEWAGDEEKAENYLRIEVKEYDHYLTGNVWGFSAEERNRTWTAGKSGSEEVHEFDSEEDAAAWISEQELVDYVGVAAGDYYIDDDGLEDDEGWEEVDGCGGGIFGDYDCIKDEVGADFADAFESAEISYA